MTTKSVTKCDLCFQEVAKPRQRSVMFVIGDHSRDNQSLFDGDFCTECEGKFLKEFNNLLRRLKGLGSLA